VRVLGIASSRVQPVGCLRCLSVFAGRDMDIPDVEARLTR